MVKPTPTVSARDSDEVSSLQPQMPGALPWAAIATLGTAWRGRGSELPGQLWGQRGLSSRPGP